MQVSKFALFCYLCFKLKNMSNHDDRFSFAKPQQSTFKNGIVTLPVTGQGVVIFSPEEQFAQLEFTAPNRVAVSHTYQYFCFRVDEVGCVFFASKKPYAEIEDQLFSCIKGYEQYPTGPFWFSIDFENRLLKLKPVLGLSSCCS